MAQSAQSAGIPVIFPLIVPAPFDIHRFKGIHKFLPLGRSTLDQRSYCYAVTEIAGELGLPAVPLWYDIISEMGCQEGDLVCGLEQTDAYR